MGRKIKYVAVCLSFLMLAPFGTDAFAKGPKKSHLGGPKNLHSGGKNFRAGAVYVLTNQTNNTVAVFRRSAKGTLTFADEFPTGGAGNPTPRPPDPVTDPLASQGALIITNGNRFLIALLGGSQAVASFRIGGGNGDLTPVDTVGGLPLGAQGIVAK